MHTYGVLLIPFQATLGAFETSNGACSLTGGRHVGVRSQENSETFEPRASG